MADGHIVYQGPAKDSAAHFAKLDVRERRFGNPADTFMRILTVNYPKTEKDESNIAEWINMYSKSCEQNVIDDMNALEMPAFNDKDLSIYKAPFSKQLKMLLQRQKLFTKREPQVAFSKFGN